MSDCIFCSIIEGRIPAYVIYQDEYFLAIMDRYPSARGHALIMPKRHAADLYELNKKEAAMLIPLAQKVAGQIRSKLGIAGLNLIQNNGKAAGQVVGHFHLHLVPRYEGDGLKLYMKSADPTLQELEQVAELLRGGL